MTPAVPYIDTRARVCGERPDVRAWSRRSHHCPLRAFLYFLTFSTVSFLSRLLISPGAFLRAGNTSGMFIPYEKNSLPEGDRQTLDVYWPDLDIEDL